MGRIYGREPSDTESNESDDRTISHRLELIQIEENHQSELMRLAGGKISEKEKIQRMRLSEYFDLLKYTVDKNNRENAKTPA